MPTNKSKVEETMWKIADLKKRWPAHSTPPALMQQLDELEAELEKALSTNEVLDEDRGGGHETHT